MPDITDYQLLSREELEYRLEEAEQMIAAIREGEVDAFAINRENESAVYTLQTGDYAYRVLIEEFGEGAINVTEEGLIVYTNRYFFELLGLPYEKVIGASIFDFVDSGSAAIFEMIFSDSLTGKSRGEINFSVNGTTIPVYISITSLQPSLPTLGIIITDLTEKKKTEKMIIEYQRDLEMKNQLLLQNNAELDSFAYIASHDLQEPLRKIQAFSTQITSTEAGNLTETGRAMFTRMRNAAARMQALILDLLAYSRTNTVERKFENTDLNEIVAEIRQDLKEELLMQNALIESGPMCSAHIIPFQFRQLLNNLISNSLKFSQPDNPVFIHISSSIITDADARDPRLLPETNYCHIIYTDNGIGFDNRYADKIFELFQRLNGRYQYQGTGIGLAIVKKIVEYHHGYISATGELDKGARFDIYLPVI